MGGVGVVVIVVVVLVLVGSGSGGGRSVVEPFGGGIGIGTEVGDLVFVLLLEDGVVVVVVSASIVEDEDGKKYSLLTNVDENEEIEKEKKVVSKYVREGQEREVRDFFEKKSLDEFGFDVAQLWLLLLWLWFSV